MSRLVFDEKWLKDYTARTGRKAQEVIRPHTSSNDAPAKSERTKYGNIKTVTEDGKFDSRHEARVYEQVKLRAKAGEIASVARQVVFYLPGGIKYIADFVVTRKDGGVEVIDAKSEATKKDKVYKIKKRLMMDAYHIEIIEQ